MSKFTEMAKANVNGCPLMVDRTKIGTDEIIKFYPDGITLTEFDILSVDDNYYPVILFAEDQTKFFFGGAVLSKIIASWMKDYAGDVKAASDDLKASGGVKIRMKRSKTKNNRDVVLIDVLD